MNSTQACNSHSRTFPPPRKRIAHGTDNLCRDEIRRISQCLLCHRDGIVIAAGEKVTICHTSAHGPDDWIKWAWAHGVTEPRTRHFRVTKPNSNQSAVVPCHGQIRIERESPINEGGTVIKFMDDIGQCKPPFESAVASSLPKVTARQASFAVSGTSRSRSIVQPFAMRWTWHRAAMRWETRNQGQARLPGRTVAVLHDWASVAAGSLTFHDGSLGSAGPPGQDYAHPCPKHASTESSRPYSRLMWSDIRV